jgi:hypothetical protein
MEFRIPSMGTDVTVVGPEHPTFDDAADAVVDRFSAEDELIQFAATASSRG